MFKTVLVACSGYSAVRVIRTLKRLGVRAVVLYAEGDVGSLAVEEADLAISCGGVDGFEDGGQSVAILDVARVVRAEAIHPGSGPLARCADLARLCGERGIVFIGPAPEHIGAFCHRQGAREWAFAANLPLLPGSRALTDYGSARAVAAAVGYPIFLKVMVGSERPVCCASEDGLQEAWDRFVVRAGSGPLTFCVEKALPEGRIVEVSILGDGQGGAWSLGTREVFLMASGRVFLAEAPALCLNKGEQRYIEGMAVRLAQSMAYVSMGAVRFAWDKTLHQAYFIEVIPGFTVGDRATEMVSGVDPVTWGLHLSAGEGLGPGAERHRGHAIEACLLASEGGSPTPAGAVVTDLAWPSAALCVDEGVVQGGCVWVSDDPVLGSCTGHGLTRADAVKNLSLGLATMRVGGLETNLAILKAFLEEHDYQADTMVGDLAESRLRQSSAIEVLRPGAQSTIQDWPGRLGYWQVGVPPSGPMDALAHRFANALVSNEPKAPVLEITMVGPRLRFVVPAIIAVTGAPFPVRVNGRVVPMWEACRVEAGAELVFGSVRAAGVRAYLAVQGGFEVAPYLGSAATFTLGSFGGHEGRGLKAGDRLAIGAIRDESVIGAQTPRRVRPRYDRHWTVGVLYGPHGASDFFTAADIDTFFSARWEVHHQSSRTGVRLIGPRPCWARADGGEAGLHPSNIHDNAYAIGAVDFTGDMPVILGPDGPSLGGFVCPAVVASSELWKLGQLRPGDTLCFRRMSLSEAREEAQWQEDALRYRPPPLVRKVQPPDHGRDRAEAVIASLPASERGVEVVYRRAGDANILVEYGSPVLDLALRMRAQALMVWLDERRDTVLRGAVIDLTPGIRSLQVHYDPGRLGLSVLMDILQEAELAIGPLQDGEVPSRIVHLPLAWDDSQTRLATMRYGQLVRKDAPWCPRNIEFIRRINGLDSEEEVRRIVYSASYLVLGLGDVYLGAPVATPVDPRHRLVTTKYNPARTWTPENAVGIGGAYLCIYGMEGPGGYQFVGRTIQMWNRYRRVPAFAEGKPWLLRFFDQIRFYPVSEEELLQMRVDFPLGRLPLKIEETRFSLKAYEAFLRQESASIQVFKDRQQAAFERERESWTEETRAAAP